MTGKQLRNSILQWAIQGKLVPQDPNDEPASVLLEKIRAEKTRLIKEGKIKKDKNESIIYRGEDNSYYEKFLSNGEIKCIDDEIPFETPNGWQWCRVGNLCKVFGRIGFRGYTKEDMVSEGEGAISISPSNMNEDGSMHFHSNTYISWNKYDESPEIKIRENDILVVKTGSSYGKTCLVPKLHCKSTINPQIAVLKYVKCNYAYLAYVLSSPNSKTQFEKFVLGTSIPTFSQEKLSSTLIPLPPLEEQNRIVQKLLEVLPVTEKYELFKRNLDQLNITIKNLLQKSILQEAIQGKLVAQNPEEEPASILLQSIRDEKLRLVKEGKLKKKDVVDSVIFRGDDNKYYEQVGSELLEITDNIPFDLPDTWLWVRLGQLVNLVIGKTPPRGDARYWSNATKNWVSISDMKEYGRIKTTKEKISDNAAETLMGSCSPIGTLLMSFKLTVGRTAILDIEAYHNEAIVSIYPFIDHQFALKEYLFYLLPILANMGDSKDAIKGKTLNSKSLNNLLVPLPPVAEQHRIVDMIETVSYRIKD